MMAETMRKKFNLKLNELIARKGKNNQLFTQKQYMLFMNKVKEAKNKTCKKAPEEYQRLARYDCTKIGDSERLIVPVKNEGDPIIHFIYLEETFDIIHSCHLSMEHPGRDRMLKQLKIKYKNITTELIICYLKLCEQCQKVKNASNKGLKPYNKFNSRCQINLIDMQSQADGDYNFILVYQDLTTKFIQLRPLKSNIAKEVAYQLLDIFTIFGAPNIMQSDNGREFANIVVEEVCTLWPDLKIVHDESRQNQPEDSVERDSHDIQKLLCTWLESNKTTKWSEGLRFIQFTKNSIHHASINSSPYEAMIGRKAKVGLDCTLSRESGPPAEKELNIILKRNSTQLEEEMESEDDMQANDTLDTNESEPINKNEQIKVKIEDNKDNDEEEDEVYYDYDEDSSPSPQGHITNANNESNRNANAKHQVPMSFIDINRFQNQNAQNVSANKILKDSKKRKYAEREAESRINKNNAIAEYYHAKTLVVKAEQEKIELEKLQLQSSIEKCNLKKAKLQLEIHSLNLKLAE